jgi:hypothetical protein
VALLARVLVEHYQSRWASKIRCTGDEAAPRRRRPSGCSSPTTDDLTCYRAGGAYLVWPVPTLMSSKEVADAFVESLKAIIDGDRIRVYPVRFDANLYDIEVTSVAWSMTLSLDGRGESFRLLPDDYLEIDGLSPPEALEFIAALLAGRALVRVSKGPSPEGPLTSTLTWARRDAFQRDGDGDPVLPVGSSCCWSRRQVGWR